MDPGRERASPTESAVMWDLAKGTLRSRYVEAAGRNRKIDGVMSRPIRTHALNVRVEAFAYPSVYLRMEEEAAVSMRVVPRELIAI